MHIDVHVAPTVIFVTPPNPTLIRVLFHLELTKPETLTSIEISLICQSKTTWPSGLPPTYDEHSEEQRTVDVQDIMYHDKMIAALNEAKAKANASPEAAQSTKNAARPVSPGGSTSDPNPSLATEGRSQSNGVHFAPGSYSCPVVFSLNSNLYPSLHLASGSYTYRVKAKLHRANASRFLPGSSGPSHSSDFFVVRLPSEVQLDAVRLRTEYDELRNWNDTLLWNLRDDTSSDMTFCLGEKASLQMTLVPVEKVFVTRVCVNLQERTFYRARQSLEGSAYQNRTHLYSLLDVKPSSQTDHLFPTQPSTKPHPMLVRLLPHPSSATSQEASPLSQFEDFEGPWNLHLNFLLQRSSAGPVPSYIREMPRGAVIDPAQEPPIEVAHELVVEVHVVKKGDSVDKVTKDVMSTTLPVLVLSHHCASASRALPSYDEISEKNTSDPYYHILQPGHYNHDAPRYPQSIGPESSLSPTVELPTSSRMGEPSSSAPVAAQASSSSKASRFFSSLVRGSGSQNKAHKSLPGSRSSSPGPENAAEEAEGMERLREFTRLIAGRVGVDGVLPPGYSFSTSDRKGEKGSKP